MAVVVKDRTCRQCGSTFAGGPRAWYCPACREERRRDADRRHKSKGTMRPLGSTDYCTVCGKPYIVNGPRQKYCTDCAPDAIKAIDNAQSRAWNAANLTPDVMRLKRENAAAKKECVICGKSFRPTDSSITCSPACSQELQRRSNRAYEAAHRQQINARKAEQRRQKLAAMTPEELAAYRASVNAAARENYRRRKEQS